MRLGYFDLFMESDLFLVYDNVQFDKDGWRNRNRIKTPNGPQWLTVPVLTKGMQRPTNGEIKINPHEPWARKQLKSIEQNYRKAAYFEEIYPLLSQGLSQPYERLIDLNMHFINAFNHVFNIQTPHQMVSEIKLDLPDGKNEKLVALCRYFGALEFYEPAGGQGYVDPALFEKNGIRLTFQQYQHPVYPQLYGDFVSHLSIIDLLFNCGPGSLEVIKKGNACSRKRVPKQP